VLGLGRKFNLEFSRYLLPYIEKLVEYLNVFLFVVDVPTAYGWRSYDEGQYQFDKLSTLKERFMNDAVSAWMQSDLKSSYMKADFIIRKQEQDKRIFNKYVRSFNSETFIELVEFLLQPRTPLGHTTFNLFNLFCSNSPSLIASGYIIWHLSQITFFLPKTKRVGAFCADIIFLICI
jgi:hypothetical protein